MVRLRTSGTIKKARKNSTCCSSSSPLPSLSPLPSPLQSPLHTPDIISGEEESGEKKRLGTLVDLDLLNCPVCFEPFTNLIFQCHNGHLACSSCCTKLRNKCPNCTLPIGNIRCRAMENIVGSISVPCKNSSFGCTEIFSYKDQKAHEKECVFSPCSCPLQDCNYRGHYIDLYNHYESMHKYHNEGWYVRGASLDVWLHSYENSYVLKEDEECLLFVVQCFREEIGVYVTVSCLAPPGVNLDMFSYHLATSRQYKVSYESPVIKRIQEVKFKKPEENFMFIPRFVNGGSETSVKMTLLIRKRCIRGQDLYERVF